MYTVYFRVHETCVTVQDKWKFNSDKSIFDTEINDNRLQIELRLDLSNDPKRRLWLDKSSVDILVTFDI